MHQDVWSRYSGGSGAPAWTLEAVGFDIKSSESFECMEDAQAAWLKGVKGGGHREDERGLWPTGYQKLVCSTINTVFWGGEVFTPKLTARVERETGSANMNVGAYLRERYLKAWEVLVKAVGDLEVIVGFEVRLSLFSALLELRMNLIVMMCSWLADDERASSRLYRTSLITLV